MLRVFSLFQDCLFHNFFREIANETCLNGTAVELRGLCLIKVFRLLCKLVSCKEEQFYKCSDIILFRQLLKICSDTFQKKAFCFSEVSL